MKIINTSNNSILATKVILANNMFTRLKGLLGTKSLDAKEACFITPCSQVHTFGMHYPIDILFLDKAGKLLGLVKNLKPNRLSRMYFRAHSVLEFMSGNDLDCKVGDTLELVKD